MSYKMIAEWKDKETGKKEYKHTYSEERFAKFAAAMKLHELADQVLLGKISEGRVKIYELEDWEVSINEKA